MASEGADRIEYYAAPGTVISNARITVTGGHSKAIAIANLYGSNGVAIRNSDLRADGSATNVNGIWNNSTDLRVMNSMVAASGGNSDGVVTQELGSAQLLNSTVKGLRRSVFVVAGGKAYAASTLLDGPTVRLDTSTMTCVGTYDAAFAPLLCQ